MTTITPNMTLLDGARPKLHQPAEQVLTRVRDSMKALIAALPAPVNRAVDLQNALGIYPTLAWRTFKIGTADDPFDIAEYILTPALLNTLLEAAARKGVPHEVTDGVRTAMDKYTSLLHEHSGNAEALTMMLESLRPKKKQRTLLDEKFRKSMFQHNLLAWGHQADAILGCFIVLPPTDTSIYRTITVMGSVGYHQLRPGRKDFTIHARVDHRGYIPKKEVIDISHGFLTDYCSPELNMQIAQNNEEDTKIRIMLPELGRKSAINYFQLLTSNAQWSVYTPNESSDGTTNLNINISSVSAMLHQDILLPASNHRRNVSAAVFGRNANTDGLLARSPEDRMPIELSPVYLGQLEDVPPAKGVPRYSEMIRAVLKRFDQYGQKFDVYRNRMPYPILKTMVSLSVDPTFVAAEEIDPARGQPR